MDINYLLILKKKYENIIFFLYEIISEYNEINNLSEKCEQNEKITKYMYEINVNKCILLDINTEIQKMCNHDFVDDYIDISPDETKQIRYCKKCEYTIN